MGFSHKAFPHTDNNDIVDLINNSNASDEDIIGGISENKIHIFYSNVKNSVGKWKHKSKKWNRIYDENILTLLEKCAAVIFRKIDKYSQCIICGLYAPGGYRQLSVNKEYIKTNKSKYISKKTLLNITGGIG